MTADILSPLASRSSPIFACECAEITIFWRRKWPTLFCFWGCFNFVFAFTSCSFLIFLLQWLTSYSACFQLKTILRKHHWRLDFQAICETAFFAPHHGKISGLSTVFFDQSQPSPLELSRLSCDWSILSLVYPTWQMSVLMSFFLLQSVF